MKWKDNHFFKFFKSNLLGLSIFFYVAAMSALCLWKLSNLGYNALDLAIFNNVFYNSIHGKFFASAIHPPSYLGDHVAPIIFLLLPIYALFADPATLLIMQTVFLALAAWPLYKITQKYLHKPWPILVALMWLLNPFVLNANLFEFHIISLIPLFLFFAIWFFIQNRFFTFVLFLVLALLVREDAALIIIPFGIISLLDKKNLKWVLTPIVLGFLYFFAALKINHVFAALNTYKYLIYYSWIGNSWKEILFFAILHPTKILFQFVKLKTLLFIVGMLIPFGFFPIFKPKYMLLSVLAFGQLALIAGGVPPAALEMHYTLFFLPALFWAFCASTKNILAKNKTGSLIIKFLQNNAKMILPLLLISFWYSFFTLGPALGLIFQEKTVYVNDNVAPKKNLIQSIPKDASVIASAKVITDVSGRKNIGLFRYFFFDRQQYARETTKHTPKPDYFLIDFTDLFDYQSTYQHGSLFSPYYSHGQKNLKKIFKDYGLINTAGTLALFKKDAASQTWLTKEYKTFPDIQTFINQDIAGQMTLLGYDLDISNKNGPILTLLWRTQKPIKKDYHIEVALVGKSQKDKHVARYPFGYGAYRTSTLLPGKIIQTRHALTWPAFPSLEAYEVSVGLFDFGGYVSLDSLKRSILKEKYHILIGEPIQLETILIKKQ